MRQTCATVVICCWLLAEAFQVPSYRGVVENQVSRVYQSTLEKLWSKTANISLEDWMGRGEIAQECLSHNEAFVTQLDDFVHQAFHVKQDTLADAEKSASLLLSLHRHWSQDGHDTRRDSIGRVIEYVENHVLHLIDEPVKVLVPGAGLGRLAFELASLSTELHVSAIEIDPVLGQTVSFLFSHEEQEFLLCPGLHITNNWLVAEDRFRTVLVPDRSLRDAPDFDYIVGSFPEKAPETADIVATSFFLDAMNPVQVMTHVKKILSNRCGQEEEVCQDTMSKRLWINDGPLVYPYSRFGDVQLPWDVLREMMISEGFSFDVEETHPCSFEQLVGQMEHRDITCIFFVAKLL